MKEDWEGGRAEARQRKVSFYGEVLRKIFAFTRNRPGETARKGNKVAVGRAGKGHYCIDSPFRRQGRCQSDIQRLEKLRLDFFCCGAEYMFEVADFTSLLIVVLAGS